MNEYTLVIYISKLSMPALFKTIYTDIKLDIDKLNLLLSSEDTVCREMGLIYIINNSNIMHDSPWAMDYLNYKMKLRYDKMD